MAESKKGAGTRGSRGTRGKAVGENPARGFRFGPANYAFLAAGAVAIVIGYVLLDGGSVTAAPLLLILGYVVLLPLGLLIGWKRLRSATEDRPRS